MNGLPYCNILILDDHALFADGMVQVLKSLYPDAHCDCSSSLADAQLQLTRKQYRFIFVDILLPATKESEVRIFIKQCQQAYPSLVIIVLSSVMNTTVVKEYLQLGVHAYISKAIDRHELQLTLERTDAGQHYISTDLGCSLAQIIFTEQKNDLTKKELEVLKLIAAGHPVRTIAELMFLSPYTIMAHRRNIMGKLDLHSGPELVKYAFENYLV